MNEAVPRGAGDLAVNVNRTDATFRLGARPFRSEVIYRLAPRTLDLLLIASSVYATDGLVRRGGDVRSGLGAQWTRDLRFVVPVSDPDFWRSTHDDLVALLDFLTGDRFTFEFVHREHRLPRQTSLDLGHGVTASQVLLFSGGLDSLTGVIDALSSTAGNVLLVTHCSASKIMTLQRRLARRLAGLFPGRITWVPARGRLVGGEAPETTQRSRSFLYAALGYAAASLVGVARLSFCENGIVSLNLPISRQVIGTMATRTTHPLFLRRLGELLSKVGGAPFAIDNPYAWQTKTEVLQRLDNLGRSDLVAATTSCSGVRHRSNEHPLCGCCSQCLDRRFAALAAGIAAADPIDRYEVELFLGVRTRAQDRTMANDWFRNARTWATMPLERFAERFGAELADVAYAYPDRPVGQVLSDAFQMCRRHGSAVDRVAQEAIGENARPILDQDLPAGSLLASLLAPSKTLEPERLMPEAGQEDIPPTDGRHSIFPLRLVYDPDRGPLLRIAGLGEFAGAHVSLVGQLRGPFEEDLAAGRTPEDHRFTEPGRLGPKGTVRQHAKRCRDLFAAEYEVVEGVRPDTDILIHSSGTRGYRLDPHARFVRLPSGPA